MAAATVSSHIHPTLPEPDGYDDDAGFPLLDLKCYVADLTNATTARGRTSTDFPIEVTLNAGDPRHLPHLCVHCPGLDLRDSKPKIVATDADLVLLRVAVNPDNTFTIRSWDFFVYHPRHRPPRLDLLPNPHPIRFFNPVATALLRDRADGYAVASLTNRVPVFDDETCAVVSADFDVHLYRSSPNHAGKGWVSTRLPVSEALRETLTPLPDAVADEMLYHDTAKAVAVGGGAVAWVDLWRGLLVCDDVLELDDGERPRPAAVLRDVPLPPPARGNRGCLLGQWDPAILRDVAVSRRGDCIKYVEVDTRGDNSDGDACCWKATVYSMPAVPVGSWEDWRVDCEVESEDITVDDSRHCHLLSKLSGRDTTSKLQQLAFPTISVDDDVVCLYSTTSRRKDKDEGVVVAVDVRKRALRGVTELNHDKRLMPIYCASEVSRLS